MKVLRTIHERMCIACNKKASKSELYRVVRSKDGSIVLDLGGQKAGRGAYVCSKTCFDKAVSNKRFQRSLKCGIDSITLQTMSNELEQALLSAQAR